MTCFLGVGSRAVRRQVKNRESSSFVSATFQKTHGLTWSHSESHTAAYRKWKGLNFCRWMGNGKPLKIKGEGLGLTGDRGGGKRGEGRRRVKRGGREGRSRDSQKTNGENRKSKPPVERKTGGQG